MQAMLALRIKQRFREARGQGGEILSRRSVPELPSHIREYSNILCRMEVYFNLQWLLYRAGDMLEKIDTLREM
jgi:hypothetical protein